MKTLRVPILAPLNYTAVDPRVPPTIPPAMTKTLVAKEDDMDRLAQRLDTKYKEHQRDRVDSPEYVLLSQYLFDVLCVMGGGVEDQYRSATIVIVPDVPDHYLRVVGRTLVTAAINWGIDVDQGDA